MEMRAWLLSGGNGRPTTTPPRRLEPGEFHDCFGMRDGVAAAQSRQAVDLRARVRDDHVPVGDGERNRRLVRRVIDVIVVCLVDEDGRLRRRGGAGDAWRCAGDTFDKPLMADALCRVAVGLFGLQTYTSPAPCASSSITARFSLRFAPTRPARIATPSASAYSLGLSNVGAAVTR